MMTDASSKAQGLYEFFPQGNVLGPLWALKIKGKLDILNMSLQSRTQTIKGAPLLLPFLSNVYAYLVAKHKTHSN